LNEKILEIMKKNGILKSRFNAMLRGKYNYPEKGKNV